MLRQSGYLSEAYAASKVGRIRSDSIYLPRYGHIVCPKRVPRAENLLGRIGFMWLALPYLRYWHSGLHSIGWMARRHRIENEGDACLRLTLGLSEDS